MSLQLSLSLIVFSSKAVTSLAWQTGSGCDIYMIYQVGFLDSVRRVPRQDQILSLCIVRATKPLLESNQQSVEYMCNKYIEPSEIGRHYAQHQWLMVTWSFMRTTIEALLQEHVLEPLHVTMKWYSSMQRYSIWETFLLMHFMKTVSK